MVDTGSCDWNDWSSTRVCTRSPPTSTPTHRHRRPRRAGSARPSPASSSIRWPARGRACTSNSSADGRSLTVFRPATGRHRVIDTDSVDRRHRRSTSAADGVHRPLRLDGGRPHARPADDAPDAATTSWLHGTADEIVSRLAAVDQDALWSRRRPVAPDDGARLEELGGVRHLGHRHRPGRRRRGTARRAGGRDRDATSGSA